MSGPSRTQPISIDDRLQLAQRYRQGGRLQEAYALYQQVLKVYPAHAQALSDCGIVAFRLGRAAEAEALLRRAVKARHDYAPAHLNHAVVLQAAGRTQDAIAATRRALRHDPGSIPALLNLANLLMEAGDIEGAVAGFEEAARREPERSGVHFQLGLGYQALGRLDRAAEALAEAVHLEPGQAHIHYSLGTVLQGMHALDEAVAAYDTAIGLRPQMLDSLFDVGKPRHIHALFERGDHAAALASLDGFLAKHPGQACALALKAIALDEIGEHAASRALVDFQHLIRPVQFDQAPGYDSIADLNQALAAHILSHPTLREVPESFSAHKGKATGELLVEPKGPVAAFEQLVRGAVEGYIANLPDLPGHPFTASLPKRWRLMMWANVLEAESFQVPHIHPSGWLSSAYYVRLPEVVRAGQDGRAGWIEFGEPYHDITHRAQPELHAIQPEEGLLLLFPSYFYHRTLPFESTEKRISIAFDVVPVP
jgi:tetratricopeptide (TPR) repeat protein